MSRRHGIGGLVLIAKAQPEGRRNKLVGWVDSDFAADPDSRKSMTGYMFSLNGGAVSWRSSRQGGVTLSSAEAEFVAASQAALALMFAAILFFCRKQETPYKRDKNNADNQHDSADRSEVE